MVALLHDAPEYVIGDMISPVKAKVGPGYDELDNRLMAAILLRFGLPSEIPVKIKRSIKVADKMSAWLESTQIAGFDKFEAGQIFGTPKSISSTSFLIKLRSPKDVRNAFQNRFKELLDQYE